MIRQIDNDTREITDHFVQESKDLIEFTVEDILNMEDNPEPELINRIFRTCHTIKGNAGMLGYPNLSSFAHKAEDLLDKIRKNEIGINKPLIDGLLEITDVFVTVLEIISRDYNDEIDLEDNINALDLLQGKQTETEPPPKKVVFDLSDDDKNVSNKNVIANINKTIGNITPEHTPTPPAKRKPIAINLNDLKVLIVEDEFVSRSILLEILSKYGNCDAAKDGQEAVTAFQMSMKKDSRYTYDLICMDILMPNLDGNEAVKKIRQIEKENGIKQRNEVNIIMTTVKRDPKTVIKSLYKSGANAYIAKPINENILLKELAKMHFLLKTKRKKEEHRKHRKKEQKTRKSLDRRDKREKKKKNTEDIERFR